jgi:hypothetical protein
MSESTDNNNKFVVLEYNAPANWAGEDDDDDQGKNLPDQKPVKAAWGKNANAVPVQDNTPPPDLKSIFAEETKKAQEKGKAPPKLAYRAPKPERRDEYIDVSPSFENFRPREKLPVPDLPPFTAFVGNLAFDVTEEKLIEYFGELGIQSVRIMKEGDKPKGYAYVEFISKPGLQSALLANGQMFYGRQLNMDVAKPSKGRTERTDRNDRSDRYDTNWSSSGRSNYQNRNSYPAPSSKPADRPTERPKLNINPPAPKPPSAQATQLHETIAKPKGSFENPFGTAPLDKKKQDELAQKRLKAELEREKKDKERKEELEKNRRPPPTSPRENTFEQNKTAASWRNKPAGTGAGPAPVRKEEKPKKTYVKDEEGFISAAKPTRGWETRDKPQDAQKPPKQTSTATKTKAEPNIDSNNIYASLVDD